MPAMAHGVRNPLCTFNALLAVNLFAAVLIFPLLLVNVAFIITYYYKKGRMVHGDFMEFISRFYIILTLSTVGWYVLAFGLWFYIV